MPRAAKSPMSELDRLRAIVRSATDFAIIATGLDARITDWNPGAERILGWSTEEMLGELADRIFTPEDQAAGRPAQEMGLAVQNGRASDERWHQRKDGSRFWASGEMMLLLDDAGEVNGFIKILRDRTRQHRDAVALREAQDSLRRAQDAGGVGVFYVGVEDAIIYPSAAFCRLYGMPEQASFPARDFEALVIDEDAALTSRAESRRDGAVPKDVEYRIRRADTGALRWIARKGDLEFDDAGKAVRFVGVARDITDQVLARQELSDEREQLAQLFEQAPTIMAILRGPQHRFERVNPGYVKLVGGRDVVGKTVAETLPEAVAQGYLELLDGVYRTGEPFSANGARFDVQTTPGGPVDERYLDFVYQPLRGPDGQVNGIFLEGVDVTDQRAVAEALALSEERYRTLFQASETGICIIEMAFDDGRNATDYLIVEGNGAFERMTGLYGSQGRWVSEIAPGLERHWFENYGHVALTGEPLRFENHAEPFGRWYDVQALRIGEPADQRVAILFNDITERKHTEARQTTLLQLADALRDLTDPTEIAYAACEVLGRALGVSRVGYGIIDKIAETISIDRDWNAEGIETLAGVLKFRDFGSYIDDLKQGGVVAIADAAADPRTRDGAAALEGISARAFVNMPLIEQGQFVALLYANHARIRPWAEADLALMREVADRVRAATERLRSELALRDSEEQFRVFAQAVPNQIWASHPDGQLYWFNERVYDYSRTDRLVPTGDTWKTIVHPDDVTAAGETWGRALTSGNVYETEFRIRRHDGVYRWFLVRAVPVRSADGAIVRWVGANTDIEDAKRQSAELQQLNATLEDQVQDRTRELMTAEEALRQSQKMEAVGQLTGGLAHDFNNLLTGITGSLELLNTRIAQGRFNDAERYITAAQGAAKRAAALTHRLLAFSRRQTLDPKATDVNRLVLGLDDLIRRTVGPEVTVEVVAAGGLWPTLVDPNQLENALLNLCINGRDAMPDGGRLTIETGNRWLDARGAQERGLDPGQYISICVSDTGTGMTPDVIAKAFDPFFTTKPLGMGTGLGLSMIYGFARQSGGQVRIYSEVGEGAMVCLYLPRYLGETEEAETQPELADAPRAVAGETVLVVDDEPTVRMLITDVLGELGYEAIEAADGASGLQILQSDMRVDLLVTDVGLPGGMNGRQMADAARVHRPDLRVLFITGYAENAVVGNGHLEAGMHVMTKPFAMDVLAARIKELIVPD